MKKLLIILLLAITTQAQAFGFGSQQYFTGSTNILLWSQDLTNAVYTKDFSSTTTATKIKEDAVNNVHSVKQDIIVIAGTAYTYSVYMKSAERTWTALQMVGSLGGGAAAWVNLTTGAVGTVSGFVGGTGMVVTPYQDGFLCAFTATATASGTASLLVYAAPSDGVVSYPGTLGSGINVLYQQLEVGTKATTYIPTTTIAVTRAARRVQSGFGF